MAQHMSSSLVDEDTKLRSAIESITSSELSYGRWLGTTDAQWVLQMASSRISGVIITRFARQYGIEFETSDIVNTLVVLLANDRIVASIELASDQWAYIYQVLNNEMLKQMGTRGTASIDLADRLAEVEESYEMPDVQSAMDLTVETLTPLTPVALRPHLREVVEYLAERGQSRISHAHTESANDADLIGLGLERHHILALANVVLGARPNHGDSSILAGFLQNSDWKPHRSILHRIALKKYSARMKHVSTTDKKLVVSL
jgi:hypothetical protein